LLAKVMRLPSPSKIDPNESLQNLGIDSLMAFELRTRIQTDLKTSLPIASLMQDPTIAKVADGLAEALTLQALIGAVTPKGVGVYPDDSTEELVRI
jgi:acyl carrier protein